MERTIDTCWFKGKCKKECAPNCNIFMEFKYLLDTSGLPVNYREPKKLQPDEEDLNTFITLAEIKDDIYNFVKEGKFLYLWGPHPGAGRAQPLYSKIMTPAGYKTMGEMTVGTEVFGEDGNAHKVTGVFPQGKKKVYELTFNDGTKCRCSDEHLWTVSTNSRKTWKTVTLQDIINDKLYEKAKVVKNGNKGRWKYQIPVTNPLVFPHKDYPIDPWVLGLLLGDGGLTCRGYGGVRMTTYESDIEERMRDILYSSGFSMNKNLKNPDVNDFNIGDLHQPSSKKGLSIKEGKFGSRIKQYIYDLGLFGHKSTEKFIPDLYKYNDIETRLRVLQGLVDADGWVQNSRIAFYTSSVQLAEDVVFLVQSLGGTCSCNEHETHYVYKGERRQGNNNFELNLKLPPDMLPFTSKKHTEKYNSNRKTGVYRNIRSIKYIGEEECQCIMVDSSNHLYLTDSMVVTHNTSWACKIALTYMALIANGNGFNQDNGVQFCYVPEFILMTTSFKDENRDEYLKSMLTKKLLILDDIGSCDSGKFAETNLASIIDMRYRNGLSTLFTSNLSESGLEAQYGARITDRILSGLVLEIKGASRRESKYAYKKGE